MQIVIKLFITTFLLLHAAFSHATFVTYTQSGGGVRDYGTVISLDGKTRDATSNAITYTDTVASDGAWRFDWQIEAAYNGTAKAGYLLNGVKTELATVQDLNSYQTLLSGTSTVTVVVSAGDTFGWYLDEAPASRDRDWYNKLTLSNVSFIAYESSSVSAVPVPAAAWLFGSGLLGLVGLRRKQQA